MPLSSTPPRAATPLPPPARRPSMTVVGLALMLAGLLIGIPPVDPVRAQAPSEPTAPRRAASPEPDHPDAPPKAAAVTHALPRYRIVSQWTATPGRGGWTTHKLPRPQAYDWRVESSTPPAIPASRQRLDVEAIMTRVRVCPGASMTLAEQARSGFPSDRLSFNRADGVIGEVFEELYPGAPRLRRASIAIYAGLTRIKTAEGRYVDWPGSFERLAPVPQTMIQYDGIAAGGRPERRWNSYTQCNPHALLKRFEYGLTHRELFVDSALVMEYHIDGPRSAWVKSFGGVDILTPLITPNGQKAYLFTTVLDCHIEFSVGNPSDGSVLAQMEQLLLPLKKRAEALSMPD